MTEAEIAVLAQKVADKVWSLGYVKDSPCQRIQFKGGTWTPDHSQETDQGGLSYTAFVDAVEMALHKYVPDLCGVDHGQT